MGIRVGGGGGGGESRCGRRNAGTGYALIRTVGSVGEGAHAADVAQMTAGEARNLLGCAAWRGHGADDANMVRRAGLA